MDLKVKIKTLVLICILACCWGPSFLFIKLAIEEIPPLTLVACRLLLGGIMVYAFLRVKGESLWPFRAYWPHFVIMAIFACSLPFLLISFGEIYISSSLAAITNSTTPVCTIILAHFFIDSERMTPKKAVGVALGFTGVFIVFLPTLLEKDPGSSFGAFLVFLSAISYAIAMVYSKKNLQGVVPLVAAAAQLLIAALCLIPLALVIEQPYLLPMPSPKAVGAVLGLAILGTAIAFPVYYAVIRLAGASAVSTSTLLFPIIGVFLGVTVLGEQIYWNAYFGSAIILLGLLLSNNLIQLPLHFARRSDFKLQ